MATIEKTEDFNVSPEQLWEVVGNPARFEEWLSMHVKWKSELPSEIAVGSTLSEVVSVMNMPNTIDWNVDVYDAPSKIELSGTGMAGIKVAMSSSISANGDGSTLSLNTV